MLTRCEIGSCPSLFSTIYGVIERLAPGELLGVYILGRCLQHRGGEPEQAKGADGMQLFGLDCIAHIVDAEMDS